MPPIHETGPGCITIVIECDTVGLGLGRTVSLKQNIILSNHYNNVHAEAEFNI